MKKLTFIIVLVTSIQYSFCQKTFDTQSDIKTNIYFLTLEKYFQSLEKNIPKNNKEYYIEKRYMNLDSYPKKINGFSIKWVKKVDLSEILESRKKDFINLVIYPMQIKKDVFYVQVAPFYAHSKFKRYTINGIFNFQYKFDSQLNGLIFKNVVMD
jgi:hypothetical protein